MLLAAEQLQKDEAQFIELFEAVQKAALRGGTSVLDQLMSNTKKSRSILVEKQWKIRINNKEIVLRERLDKIMNAIQLVKDLATRIDPVHAGIPWGWDLCPHAGMWKTLSR
jgi:hypothetical protein